MELDFSEKIRQLGLSTEKNSRKNVSNLKNSDLALSEKQIFSAASESLEPIKAEMQMESQNYGIKKSVCKVCGMKWGSCAHASDTSNMMEEGPDHESKESPDEESTEDAKAEMMCKDCNCGKSSSECACADCTSKMESSESAKEMKHSDEEDKKDVESEKSNPNAEKEEDMKMKDDSEAKQSQESKDIKDIEKKGDMNKTGTSKEKGETKDQENSEDKKMSKASLKVVSFLSKKVEKNNENNDRQVTLAQLVEVFKRGAKIYENTHRIGVSRNQWAFARVNSFLKMIANQSVNTVYAKADSDILNNNFHSENIDFISFEEIEFQLAKIAVLECGLTDTEASEEILFAADNKKKL